MSVNTVVTCPRGIWWSGFMSAPARAASVEPGGEFGALLLVHVQAAFGAAPQHVVRLSRPLVHDQVIDFALHQTAAKITAQFIRCLRFLQNDVGIAAMATEQAGQKMRVELGVFLFQVIEFLSAVGTLELA